MASIRSNRGFAGLAAALLALVVPASAPAQDFTWNQAASGGTWDTAANWLPNSGTPNAMSAVAILGNVATGANTINLPGTGVTVGTLSFADVTTNSLTAAYTIGSAGQTITFNNGASGSLLNLNGFTNSNQTIVANLVIGGTQPLTITNNAARGVTSLTISGGISAATTNTALNFDGASNTTVTGVINNTVGTLTMGGSGVLTLGGANTYTGGTVINAGTVRITNNNQLGNTSGGVTLNGGTLHFAAATTSARNFTIGANGGTFLTSAGDGVSNPSITGVISSAPTTAGTVTFDGGLYINIQNSNTYVGPTVINNAGVMVSSVFLGPNGRLSNTSSITINGFVGGQVGILDVQNGLVSDQNRINNAAPITLNGGILSFLPGLSGSVTEQFGALTVRGFGTLFANQFVGGTGTGVMAFGTVSRLDVYSTLYAGGPIAGPSAPGSTTQVTFSGGISTIADSGVTTPVVPWIGGDIGEAGSPTALASTLYTYDSNGLRALDPAGSTHFQQISAGGAFNGLIPGAKNNSISGNPAAVNTPVTILSLVQNPTSTASSTITGSSVLTISSGALANINQMAFDGPSLNFAANTGYWYLGNEAVVMGTSRITNSGLPTDPLGLVLTSNSGNSRNTLYLFNTAFPNAFEGGLYLNGTARVAFDTADTQLGAAGEVISFRGGGLRYMGASSISLSTSGTHRPLVMSAAGGGMISVETAAGVLTVPGLVSGPEQLTVVGTGTLVLSNTANTYAGGTTIGNATLGIAGSGSLGTGPVTLGVQIGATQFVGGTLRFDYSGTLAANIRHDFSHTLNTNGNNVTLSGVISGNGATLTKAGTGNLTLSAANTYSGNTVVTAGNLVVTNTTGSGTGYGSVTVNNNGGLGGSGTVGGPVTVNSGGRLIAGVPNGVGTLTLRGRTTMVSGSIFQARLAGNTAGTGYAQLVISAGTSLDLGSATFQPTLAYTPNSLDKLFIINNQNASGGLTGTFNGLADGATVTFGDGTTAQISYFGNVATNLTTGGNDVVLHTFVPVPEPATVLGLAGVGLTGLLWRKRRKCVPAG